MLPRAAGRVAGPRMPAGSASAPPPAQGASVLSSWAPALVVAGGLCLIVFFAGGGLMLGRMTGVEMALTLGSGAAVALLLLRSAPRLSARYGLTTFALLAALAVLTALSIVWSVQPDDSYRDAGRMLAYTAFFGASVALARALPVRWPAVLGGAVIAAVVVCGYALLTKIFPDQLDANDVYARLRAPYSYWNAIGLTAAMGAIGCMWLGARRSGHALLSALAYPAMGLMLLTLMLAYSRGALVALALGVALWLSMVPLRLRGAAVLIAGAAGAGAVVAWDFSTHALSSDGVALGARTAAGHRLGVLAAAMLMLLCLTGLAVGFLTARRPPSQAARRRAGAVLLAMLALSALAVAGALAASHRGFTGTIGHGLHTLTDPHAPVPSNTPGRLTAVGSVRARYWNEALKVFQAHPWVGAGAEGYATARLRYRTETLDVRHAHGFIVQTMADLGLIGLALVLTLFAAFMAAASRCAMPLDGRGSRLLARGAARTSRWSSRWPYLGQLGGRLPDRGPEPYSAERVGMLTLFCLVVVFGIHSFADWTWYVPGDACVALLCAGWLAGRGPLTPALPGAHPGEAPGEEVARRRGRRTLWGTGGPAPLGWQRSSSAAAVARLRGLAFGRADARARLRATSSALAGAWRESLQARPRALSLAGVALAAALLAAWAEWQPQRSEDARQSALALLAHDPRAALARAQSAVDRDPLSAQALFAVARAQQLSGRQGLATKTLQRAVRLQPSNPETWLALGEDELALTLAGAGSPRSALGALSAAIYLNPESIAPELIARGDPEAIAIQNDYVRALRASASAPVKPRGALGAPKRAARPPVPARVCPRGCAGRRRAAARAGATPRPTPRSPAGRTGRATRSSSTTKR